MDAEDIIMSLPSVYRKNFNKPVPATQAAADIHPNSRGCALSDLERFEPSVATPDDAPIGNVVGALTPRGANVQVFYERYKVSASIQIPGAGTLYMNFQNILVAEDKLMTARRDDNDVRFAKHLYREFIEPMRPITVDGNQGSHAYRFAGSPIYDKGWFEDVYCACAFALPIWSGDVMTNLWIVDGSRLYDVKLEPNPNMTTAKAPKWTGKVR